MPPVAVDIGGSKIQVVDAGRDSAPVTELATPVGDGPEAIADCVARAVTVLSAPGPIVVASAGSLNVADGVVHYAANLPFAEFPLAARLAASVGAPVQLVGDAVAGAVAEFATGAAAGQQDGVYITVSTGIGIGIVVRGRLLTGRDDQAGELGHIPVVTGPDALPCTCGQVGCLEAYASGRALAVRAGSTGRPPGQRTARDVVALARSGDPATSVLLAEALELLAAAVAGVVRLLAPRAVVLGGGLLLAGGLLSPLRERVARILASTVPGVADTMVPAAHGRFSSLRGAALIARSDPAARALLHGLEEAEESR